MIPLDKETFEAYMERLLEQVEKVVGASGVANNHGASLWLVAAMVTPAPRRSRRVRNASAPFMRAGLVRKRFLAGRWLGEPHLLFYQSSFPAGLG